MKKETVLYAVGDVAPRRQDMNTIFDRVRPMLTGGDVGFCQLEASLSDRGTPLPQARLPMRTDPAAADAIAGAGFHVVSFAGNHCMDWGRDALFDTMDTLRGRGLAGVGAGKNIDEARKPAVVEKDGTRIAFLAVNTILPMNYWAETDRPGCAPMRALTVYEPVEHDQPGTPPRIHTFPHRDDLQALLRDIRHTRQMADIVVLSIHWGIHFVPAEIADYQREIAHRAIEEGADILLGHHPHILKGIEVYRGKPIFYSLGNFAIEQPDAFMDGLFQSRRHKEIEALNPDWDTRRAYAPPPDTRKSMVVRCLVEKSGIRRVSFHPVEIDVSSAPEILREEDPRFHEVVDYIRRISKDQGLASTLTVSGGEVIVSG